MNEDYALLIPIVREAMQIDLTENISFEKLKDELSSHINFLIQTDLQKLVSILYRVDVSESKLSLLLKENKGKDASIIIAGLVIERLAQKMKSRKEHHNDENISDDEKW